MIHVVVHGALWRFRSKQRFQEWCDAMIKQKQGTLWDHPSPGTYEAALVDQDPVICLPSPNYPDGPDADFFRWAKIHVAER